MGKLNIGKFVKKTRVFASKHSPEILTGIGIAGMITTTILAVKATPKALEEIETLEEPTKGEVFKATWKFYVPAAVTGVASTACLIGATSVNLRRNAALATAYQLSTTALTEYKEKVVETIGEKKEQEIRKGIAKDKMDKAPVQNSEVIITGKGDALCFDVYSSRYFKSDIDKIKRAQNELNARLLSQGYLSLNEYYTEIGLRHTPTGYTMGWRVDKGLIDLYFSSHLSDNGEPCLSVDFNILPDYGFDSMI